MPTVTTNFSSDNVTSACPEVINAIVAANAGHAGSYGADFYTAQLKDRLCDVFETEIEVFPTLTGTAANALSLASVAPSFGKIYCHRLAHVNTDECAAPEFFTGGSKLIAIDGANGHLSVDLLEAAIQGAGNVHHAQPAALSVTQACETGTVYTTEEISALAEVAHAHDLSVHMDGARFANALISLGVTPAQITWQAGIDVLSFGGTKNGCLAAEAVVFFKKELVGDFAFRHKRAGQLLSKMRFVSAQLMAYLDDDVWLRNASHANLMAARLSETICQVPGVELAFPTQSNEVFVTMNVDLIEKLRNQGVEINDEELDGKAVRFVAAWNTPADEIDRFAETVLACAKENT